MFVCVWTHRTNSIHLNTSPLDCCRPRDLYEQRLHLCSSSYFIHRQPAGVKTQCTQQSWHTFLCLHFVARNYVQLLISAEVIISHFPFSHFPSLPSPAIQIGTAFFSPVFSILAILCCIFLSRIFHLPDFHRPGLKHMTIILISLICLKGRFQVTVNKTKNASTRSLPLPCRQACWNCHATFVVRF